MCKGKKWCLIGLLLVVSTLLLSGWAGQVQAQEKYPNRPIEIMCALSPGGVVDLTARILAGYLTKKWGVPVNVVNKPGGNTIPASLELYHATPDGYTFLADSNNSTSLIGIVVKNLPFKVLDRTFIATVSVSPMVFIVPSSSPFKSLKDVEMEAKKDPGNLTWTSLGGTGTNDYALRQFFKAIGVDVLKTKPIMAQGGAQSVVHTAGGHVKLGMGTASSTRPAIDAGTVRPLAITSTSRYPGLPDVPTTTELGYPTVTGVNWVGITGPPGLPSQIVDKWGKATQEMLNDPEIISKLKNIAAMPFYHNAPEFKEYVMKQTEEVTLLWGLK